LSKPHYRGQNNQHFRDIQGLPPYHPSDDDSYIDIEPTTGDDDDDGISPEVQSLLSNSL